MQPIERIFAIPDIHGRADLLERLMIKLKVDEGFDKKKDKLVFLGDLIDRGPWSKQVVEMVMDYEDQCGKETCIVLRGNHESFCLDWHAVAPDLRAAWLWSNNGGSATLNSYGTARRVSSDHLEWMSKLRFKHTEQFFFFSHAPVPRENRRSHLLRGYEPPKPFTEEELTWSYDRDEPGFARDFKNSVVGVCGHIHRLEDGIREPRFYPHYIFADSGAGCDQRDLAPLVAIEVKSRKIIYAYSETRDMKILSDINLKELMK